MKKTGFLLLGLLWCAGIQAQHIEIGGTVGVDNYINHTAISVINDPQDTYHSIYEAAHVGYTKSNLYRGIQLGYSSIRTSAINLDETAYLMDISLVMRRIIPTQSPIEPFMGLSLRGIAVWNSFTYLNNTDSRSRYGMAIGFEMGANYRFSTGTYLGIKAFWDANGYFFGNIDALPTGLVPNTSNNFGRYGIMMHFGVTL